MGDHQDAGEFVLDGVDSLHPDRHPQPTADGPVGKGRFRTCRISLKRIIKPA